MGNISWPHTIAGSWSHDYSCYRRFRRCPQRRSDRACARVASVRSQRTTWQATPRPVPLAWFDVKQGPVLLRQSRQERVPLFCLRRRRQPARLVVPGQSIAVATSGDRSLRTSELFCSVEASDTIHYDRNRTEKRNPSSGSGESTTNPQDFQVTILLGESNV